MLYVCQSYFLPAKNAVVPTYHSGAAKLKSAQRFPASFFDGARGGNLENALFSADFDPLFSLSRSTGIVEKCGEFSK
jgi:hypothetical protein